MDSVFLQDTKRILTLEWIAILAYLSNILIFNNFNISYNIRMHIFITIRLFYKNIAIKVTVAVVVKHENWPLTQMA